MCWCEMGKLDGGLRKETVQLLSQEVGQRIDDGNRRMMPSNGGATGEFQFSVYCGMVILSCVFL